MSSPFFAGLVGREFSFIDLVVIGIPIWVYGFSVLLAGLFIFSSVRLFSGPKRPVRGHTIRMLIFCTFCAGLIFARSMGVTGLIPYLRALGGIRPGMTEAEAIQAMKKYPPEYSTDENWPKKVIFFRFHDADVGVVQLSEGKVVSVEFHPD